MNLTNLADFTPNRKNLLNPIWNFDEISGVVVVESGTLTVDTNDSYYGDSCLKLVSADFDDPDSPTTVSISGITAPKSGYYFFSFFLKTGQEYDYQDFVMNFDIYVDGVETTFTGQPIAMGEYNENGWNRFSMQFPMDAADSFGIRIRFEGDPSSSENNVVWWLDAFKLEFIKSPVSWPSFYTPVEETPTGWAQYIDGVYTSGAPFPIADGVTSNMPNVATIKVETDLPTYVTGFYNAVSGKLFRNNSGSNMGVNNGDLCAVNIEFNAVSDEVTGALKIALFDDAELMAQSQVVSTTAQKYYLTFNVPITNDILTNGLLVKATSINGITSIYDISYTITRIYKR